jgi:hypothetical protein
MRRSAALLFTVPALLSGQTAALDGGRLEPDWFGPGVTFQSTKALGFQWLKPGLDLRRRSIRLKAWEPAAWVLGKRALKDQAFLQRVEDALPGHLEKGLRRGLKGSLPVSQASGDLHLIARVVDAVGQADDYMSMGAVVLSFDLKLVDGDTGELLGAFHDTLEGTNPEAIPVRFGRWCEDLGRTLGGLAAPPVAPSAVRPEAPKPVQVAPPPPAFDLEGALRRIEGLKRDGLLSEEEYQTLKKKAADRAK